jgi:carboxypeptidase Taq
MNRVTPSFIRIEADEMTYPAHILLRTQIERDIINGVTTIDDLPERWNNGLQKLLGITPANPSEGCMQDVHWPCGYMGYFPAYTLGDMTAVQLFKAACKANPAIKEKLRQGDFAPLTQWLNQNVHSKGSSLTYDQLMTEATGEPLNAAYYLNHLRERYCGEPSVSFSDHKVKQNLKKAGQN